MMKSYNILIIIKNGTIHGISDHPIDFVVMVVGLFNFGNSVFK